MSRFFKLFTYVLVIGSLFYGSVILFGSLYLKQLIEKYDKAYSGREIEIERLYINPFTGHLQLKGLKIKEAQSDIIFISTKSIEARVNLLKLFSGIIELGPVYIDALSCNVNQTKQFFNFSDLARLFDKPLKGKIRFNMQSIELTHGSIHYSDLLLPLKYSIHDLKIETKNIRWDQDTLTSAFSFLAPNDSGSVRGLIHLNLKTLNYRLALNVVKYPLDPIEPYLKAMSNYCEFSAQLDAQLSSQGNIKHRDDYTNSGTLQLSDLHLGKNSENDYFSFSKLTIAMREISPQNYSYHYDSITVYDPYFKYERYTNSDNIRAMFGKDASLLTAANADSNQFNLVIELGHYLKTMSRNFLQSNYSINRLAVYRGEVKFNDFSNSEKFKGELTPLTLSGDSLDARNENLIIQIHSQIKQGGTIAMSFSLDPKNPLNLDLLYFAKNIPLEFFNPYVISNASFGFTQGNLDLDGFWELRTGMIHSKNHLVIRDAEIKKRPRNDGIQYLPAHLILSLLKNRNHIMDYQIPINGTMKNPEVHLKSVFLDAMQRRYTKFKIIRTQDKLTKF